MSVADKHRVDLAHADVLQQPRHGRITNVYEQSEPIVLNEVAAACLARLRPGTTPAKHGQPHPRDTIEWAKPHASAAGQVHGRGG
jgi:hypothetical protein